MKKILIAFTILFIFILPVKADLTKEQGDDLAAFSENFIIEGNKRLDKKGFPLLAYMQGQARIDGHQSKLHWVGYDYNHINLVNANKWTFDCASYASFVYYHTFGLALTYSKTSNIDSYSGLVLRSPTANPYQVEAFVDDANHGEHFYYVMKGVNGANINLNDLKKGDLMIYVGHHIMIYVGDGKIAEATTSCISKDNLGMQVIPLTSKYSNIPLTVIRLKNKIIPNTAVANTRVTWLDTNETVELVSHAPKIEEYPQINYTKPTSNWSTNLEIQFNITATNGLKSYSFSNNDDNWISISGTSYSLKKTITENGTYYLKVKDTKDLTKEEKIVISTIDNIKPVIKTLSVIQKDNYSIINVLAEDLESGLANAPYSFDNGQNWTSKNTFDVNVEKEYIVKVKDNAGNIISMPINVKINNVSEIKPSISNILYGVSNNGLKKVTIVILNCSNCQIIIKKSNGSPNESDMWMQLDSNNYITDLPEGSYNVWIKDASGNLSTKSFNVEIEKNNRSWLTILLVIVPIFIIGVGFYLISKRKRNEV